MMEQAIQDFAQQFTFTPKVEHGPVRRKRRVIVLGMGGSHLAADLLRVWDPSLSIAIHSDYGLPPMSATELKDCLFIASSYSGNTEETLSGFREAVERKLPVVAIAVGGSLLAEAQEHDVPFVALPDTGIQPRSALGYSLMALLALLGLNEGMAEAQQLAATLNPSSFEARGKELASAFAGKVPLIYASTANGPIAYNWKIKLNETGKIPAFMNVVPELNHNEMNGFDAADGLQEHFQWLFLTDASDHPRVQKRMAVLEEQLAQRTLTVLREPLQGDPTFHKIFSSLLTADWCAVHLAAHYGHEAEQVPMIEEFKKRMTA